MMMPASRHASVSTVETEDMYSQADTHCLSFVRLDDIVFLYFFLLRNVIIGKKTLQQKRVGCPANQAGHPLSYHMAFLYIVHYEPTAHTWSTAQGSTNSPKHP